MTHFRYVPRAVLWRYPSGTGVRLPRWRSRRPSLKPGRDDHFDQRFAADTGAAAAAGPGPDFPVEEAFDLVPAEGDEDRSQVKRRLDRLIRTYNLVRARSA